MDSERDKPSRYRQRAEQLRAIAADLADDRAKKVLLGAADDYEAMAVEGERAAPVAGTTPKSSPPRDI